MNRKSGVFKRIKNWRKRKYHRFRNKPIDKVFGKIYTSNHWDGEESVSGRGSDDIQTATIQKEIPIILQEYDIKSVLDIPCGDFYWMKNLDFSSTKYVGGDVVPELVKQNQQQFATENIEFQVLDLTSDELPMVDLVFTRDCLVHFSYADIKKALRNILRSNSKYLLTTSFEERLANQDIVTGDWRPINLLVEPFTLPEPLKKVLENCTEGDGAYTDKSLLLWQVEQLKNLDFIMD